VTRDDVRREWDRGFELAGTTAGAVRERIEAARRPPDLAPHPAAAETGRDADDFRYRAPGEYPPTLATVIHHTKVPTLKKQPGYEKAKRGGDLDALVTRKAVDEIKRRKPGSAEVYARMSLGTLPTSP
jgi:hypothetical protein